MNTEEYLLFSDLDIDIEKVKVPDFSEEEYKFIENYIEFTRHIQEIDQLFRIFKINFQDILLHYQLYNNDTIIRQMDLENKEDDIIIINALVINYISSAKTFTESVENFIVKKLGKDELEKFKSMYLSKIYDENFSYRLLIRLRDYAQHGHLPVHMSYDKKYSFDLEQILYTPHFSQNQKMKDEITNIIEKIYNEFGNNPRIMFTRTIAEFQLCVFEIYISFISTIKEMLIDLEKKLEKLIKERPEVIHNSEDILNGFIFYTINNENLHCFNPKESPQKMLVDIEKNLKKEFRNEKKNFNKLLKSYKFVTN